ncbi:MAG: YihY/virulence factor BrkB family protein [Oscillospiraceae bacterium]|nr:YihY/virulence factor BrkB family protein [Oscillospiraceae bacterium]
MTGSNFNNLKNLIKKIFVSVKKDDLISSANDMTYKLFFSVFPFSIFLMSVAGFLNLDINPDIISEQISEILPGSLTSPVTDFITEISRVRNANILSFSLVVSVWGASSGFRTAMRSINKAYGQKDARKIYIKIPVSVALVLIFTVIIIISFVLVIFGNNIFDLIWGAHKLKYKFLFDIIRYSAGIIITFVSVILINKLALYKNKKTGLKRLVPGTLLTVFLWLVISRFFNIYIDNFSNYSALYGSIAAIIILMLWLNIMCVVLLLGSEINAALE